MEVHRQLGQGFLAIVYHVSLALELAMRSVPFVKEHAQPVRYKGMPLPCSYRADFVCFGEVLVKPKALDRLTNTEEAQVINYLKATGLTRALLINFGTPRLQYRRVVSNYQQ